GRGPAPGVGVVGQRRRPWGGDPGPVRPVREAATASPKGVGGVPRLAVSSQPTDVTSGLLITGLAPGRPDRRDGGGSFSFQEGRGGSGGERPPAGRGGGGGGAPGPGRGAGVGGATAKPPPAAAATSLATPPATATPRADGAIPPVGRADHLLLCRAAQALR